MKAISFLLLDDDEDSRFLLRKKVEGVVPNCRCVEAAHPEDAFAALARIRFDAVFTDHHLADSEGVSFVADVRQRGIMVPVIMVTNSVDPAVRAAALKAGANEVLDSHAPQLLAFLRMFAAP